jgi:hypothetical protein
MSSSIVLSGLSSLDAVDVLSLMELFIFGYWNVTDGALWADRCIEKRLVDRAAIYSTRNPKTQLAFPDDESAVTYLQRPSLHAEEI